MDLLSVGPLRAASLVWQPKAAAWTFTVVCGPGAVEVLNAPGRRSDAAYPPGRSDHAGGRGASASVRSGDRARRERRERPGTGCTVRSS